MLTVVCETPGTLKAEDRPVPVPAEGDDVYVMPYLSCGGCVACRIGRTNCCVHLQVLGVHRDGALCEYVSVPRRFVHTTSSSTPPATPRP